MKALLWLPDMMEYSICPFSPLSASEAYTFLLLCSCCCVFLLFLCFCCVKSDFSQDEAALLSPLDPEAGPGPDPESRGPEQVPDFPPPTGREMILRTCVPSPACFSRALPQRMFCVLLKDEFRLAAALSHDTTFF
ncbi:rab3 GTPase-activating protein catalytic subunit-like [Boleophthalmus pectinirostris]|uniref:rab3 GTPase-activating protein catalytic subunit-like n=1 Tax=Boleophthalmus pectinirostris TaxID=150288 RepID=UPI00242AA580|nr:rab3 GTPase-activating protein catalytic subunit-like [Boleophthalmus pectinirostris]